MRHQQAVRGENNDGRGREEIRQRAEIADRFERLRVAKQCHRPAFDDHRLMPRVKHQAAGLVIGHGKQDALDLRRFEIPADGRVGLSAEAHPQRRRPGDVDLFYRQRVGESESREIPNCFLQDRFRQIACLLGSGLRIQGGNQQGERLVRALQLKLGPGGVDPRARELRNEFAHARGRGFCGRLAACNEHAQSQQRENKTPAAAVARRGKSWGLAGHVPSF